jgi:hypothetical protein
MHITTLGIDVAKNVFQLHGVEARGRAVLSRRVKRGQLLQAVASLVSDARSHSASTNHASHHDLAITGACLAS